MASEFFYMSLNVVSDGLISSIWVQNESVVWWSKHVVVL
jgi:hypothetical protein